MYIMNEWEQTSGYFPLFFTNYCCIKSDRNFSLMF